MVAYFLHICCFITYRFCGFGLCCNDTKMRYIIRKCQQKNFSTIEIVQTIDTHTECYKTIVSEIIKVKYAQNHGGMWANFIQYIDCTAAATAYIQRPDSCYPQCGSIIGINAATSKFDAAKQYLEQLIQINQ